MSYKRQPQKLILPPSYKISIISNDNYLLLTSKEMPLSQFIKLGYWFDLNPSPEFKFFYLCLIIFGAFIAIGLALSVIILTGKTHKILRRYLRKIKKRLYTFGIVGLMLTLLRHEGAYFLSMRLWMLILGILFIVWVILTIIKIAREYPQKKLLYENKKKALRYKN